MWHSESQRAPGGPARVRRSLILAAIVGGAILQYVLVGHLSAPLGPQTPPHGTTTSRGNSGQHPAPAPAQLTPTTR